LIRAKPRPLRTGLELRINFSFLNPGKVFPEVDITYGKSRIFPAGRA
jgi:hypothetical protein